MIRLEKLLMIGATCRNSGKTELASMFIRKFSKKYKLIGLKVSAYYGDDEQFHSQNQLHLKEKYILIKDTDKSTEKSTAKMLSAGAAETYWLQSKQECLNEVLQKLLPQLDKEAYIVCESNSLRKEVVPDIFIMIQNNLNPMKNSATGVIKLADVIVESDGRNFINFDNSMIDIENGKWKLKNG